ncbi:FecR domain-containing protein [Planctomicrobium sp. SH661]|uniref:FecR domain-containing protein n=1 Tax=Planctomicrobium sp. SH661 TaxID=3448124 RepID=UPI003F5BF87B
MAFLQSELHSLLDLLFHDSLSSEQRARLQEILRESEEARREYFSYVDIHLGMMDLEEQVGDELYSAACCLPEIQKPAQPRRRRAWTWGLVGLCGIAGAALLAFTLNRAGRDAPEPAPGQLAGPTVIPAEETAATVSPSEAPAPLVTLTQAADAELLLEYVPSVGAPLKINHEYYLLKGLMELTFQNGATVTLKSPSVFTVQSATRMEMKVGNCSVHAPEQAKGFEVITPQSRIVDLGTRFSVVASESGVSDVQVVEGAIEVHPPESQGIRSMLLEGEAVRLVSASPDPQPIPFDRRQYHDQFPDRVISYEATEPVPGEGVHDLVSVTVQRGGQIRKYQVEELTGIDVTHFSSDRHASNAACLGPIPENILSLLTDDVALTSGVMNFSRAPGPYVPMESFSEFRNRHGMAIQFRQPVVNGPGPDAVLFEVQSAAYPAGGDRFYVSPTEDQPGLKTHLIERFDIALNTTNAKKVAPLNSIVFETPIRSVEDFARVNVSRVNPLSLPFYALAVGIDFSDLGYPEGASVSGLFIEDAEDEDHIVVDPVFIGGLPE